MLPKYTTRKRKGNIGEALVQYLLSHFCLVHKIDGSNDIGNDFICELIKNQYPTNLLFYVQVKFTKTPPSIAPTTFEYWKTSPIPVYLFWVKGDPPSSFTNIPDFSAVDKYYKRMTPKLHRPDKHKREKFKKYSEKDFKRDLIIDYARVQYQKGLLPIVEPRDFLTLDEKQVLGFPKYQLLIKDVIPEYKNIILERGWVYPLVTANLLSRFDDSNETLELAERSINLAQSLLQRSGDRNRGYQWIIEAQKVAIIQKKANRQER